MKKKASLFNTLFYLTLPVLMVPSVNAGWEDMEVLKYYFEIDSTPRHQSRAEPDYNALDNEFIGFWSTQGMIRDDCEAGDDYECTHNFKSVDGRRISPDGEILGELQLFPPGEDDLNGPDLAHNIFTNEYLTATPIIKEPASYELYITIIDSVGNVTFGPEPIYEGGDTTVMLPEVFFNAKRREYLVLYNDRNIFNSYLNNVGFILDEDGTKKKGPFEVGNQVGDFFAQRVAYNSKDDTYLVAWEDFRNVAGDWTAKCDLYAALLDAEGGMIAEMAIADDFGMPDEGDQRVPVPVYNPDRNEFLVVFKDIKESLDDAAIMGRFVNANGTLAGEAFVVVDPPRMQHWPDIKYVKEEKKYFMVWNDLRNDGLDPYTPFYISPDIDVYGRWLDPSGQPVGDEVLIADNVEWQFTPHMAYNPVMRRFLITWHDRNPVDDYYLAPSPLVPFAPAPSDVRGTLYGAESFLSGRVIEEGETGNPVENGLVLVMGPSLPTLEKTNVGGWFNTVENGQPDGQYLLVAFKFGYFPVIQVVDYEGNAVQEMIEMRKLW